MQLTSAFQRLSSIEERSLYDQTHIQTSNDDAPQRQRNTHRRGRRRRQHREREEGKRVNPPLSQVLRTVVFKHVRKNDERVFWQCPAKY